MAITCTTLRRQFSNGSFSQSTTVESAVRMWAVATPDGDVDGGLGTDSAGIHDLYAGAVGSHALFFTTDGTHTTYDGYQDGVTILGTIQRSGSTVTISIEAMRFGAFTPGAETIPEVVVNCTGSTTLSAAF